MYSKRNWITLFYAVLSCMAIPRIESKANWIQQSRFIREFSQLYNNKFIVFIKSHDETDERLSDLINMRNVFSRTFTSYTTIHDFSNFFKSFKSHIGMTTVYIHIDSVRIPEINTMLMARFKGMVTWLCDITSNTSMLKLREVYPPIDSKFFLVKWDEGNKAKILEMYRIRRSDEEKVRYFGVWDEKNGLDVEEIDLTKRRQNLNGTVLKYFTYNNGCSDTCTYEAVVEDYLSIFECFNLRLWNELEERFNFTTRFTDFQTEDDVSHFVSNLAEGECDSGPLSLVMSPTRMNKIRFMWPLFTSRVVLLTAVAGSEIGISSFLKPCSGNFWLTLAGWLTLTGTLLALFNYIVDRTVYHNKSSSADFGTFYIPFQAICSQGCTHESSWTGIRIVLIMCYIMPVIFLSAYSGRIISSLANPERIPFKNLKDFEENREYKLTTYKNSFLRTVLETDSIFERSRQKSLITKKLPEDSKTAFKEVCTQKVTLITEMTAVALSSLDCSIYFLDDIIGQYYGTMGLTPYFSFTEAVNRYIQKTITSGVRLKTLYRIAANEMNIELSFSSSYYKTKHSGTESLEPVSIDNLTLLFAIILSGFTLSLIMFILEVWNNAKHLKNKINTKLK